MGQGGFWFDGQVALERPVAVRPGPRCLTITDSEGSDHEVATADLVRLPGDRQKLKLGHRSIEGWRLTLAEPVDPEIVARLPSRPGSLGPAIGRQSMVALITLPVAASLLAATILFAPQTVARHMPMAWERRIGSAFDLPIDAARCDDVEAVAALEAIVDRLDPEARRDGFTVELVDVDETNAAALPGGRMIVFNGLFEGIEDPDAIAGIVAHEIAHVRRRHVATGMVRQLGLGTVVALAGGGAFASNAGGLLSMTFTREAEAEADRDAIAMLRTAGIDPRPTGQAFDGFRRKEGDWPEWLASHPASGGRAERFRASHEPGRGYRPALPPSEARALMAACRD